MSSQYLTISALPFKCSRLVFSNHSSITSCKYICKSWQNDRALRAPELVGHHLLVPFYDRDLHQLMHQRRCPRCEMIFGFSSGLPPISYCLPPYPRCRPIHDMTPFKAYYRSLHFGSSISLSTLRHLRYLGRRKTRYMAERLLLPRWDIHPSDKFAFSWRTGKRI